MNQYAGGKWLLTVTEWNLRGQYALAPEAQSRF